MARMTDDIFQFISDQYLEMFVKYLPNVVLVFFFFFCELE